MITNNEMLSIAGGDKILYTAVLIYNDILAQGYSKFTLVDEYDFHRLYELFVDDGYEVIADIDNLFMEIRIKYADRQS